MKKINLIILFLLLCSVVFGGELDDYLVILHSNDVHGRAITTKEFFGYAGIKKAKENLEKQGATVFLFDGGDFSQGTVIVNISKGANAIDFMNRAGYDVVTLGNHEFDFGTDNLINNLKNAKFNIVSSNIFSKDGKSLFKENVILKDKKGNKIGVFGLETPECSSSVNPKYVENLKFAGGEEMYGIVQKQIDYLKSENCSLVVCLGHLGVSDYSKPNRSFDVAENTKGIDLFIDGHSHTRFTEGQWRNKALIVSTGCNLNSIGYVAYKLKNNSEYEFVKSGLYDRIDPFISVIANGKVGEIDKKLEKYINGVYEKIIKNEAEINIQNMVDLNGNRLDIRSKETNLGDLIADACLDYGQKADSECVASIVNGGSIRCDLKKGLVSMVDLNTAFPFQNKLCLLKVSGKDLLEVLEVSACVCPNECGGFPQISGMEIEIDTGKEFLKGKQYPDSVYYSPEKINRVTIKSVGGETFDINKIYTVVTLDFLANGGDSYYLFTKYPVNETENILVDVFKDYLINNLNSVVDESYAYPLGRIKIK